MAKVQKGEDRAVSTAMPKQLDEEDLKWGKERYSFGESQMKALYDEQRFDVNRDSAFEDPELLQKGALLTYKAIESYTSTVSQIY